MERRGMMASQSQLHMDQSALYTVRVQGRLGSHWAKLFEGMEMRVESDTQGHKSTMLIGRVADQAALYGLLRNLYTMGMPLIAVYWNDFIDLEGEDKA
jgi:hypothetical protein